MPEKLIKPNKGVRPEQLLNLGFRYAAEAIRKAIALGQLPDWESIILG